VPNTEELDDEFLNCVDVARILKFTPQHIRRMAELKVIPARQYGKEWRFRRCDLIRAHVEGCGLRPKSQDIGSSSMPTVASPPPGPAAPPKRPRGRPRISQ
jgi:hypothetical protein